MPPSQVTLEVPEGSSPGSILQLCVQGQTLQVAVPDGAVPGTVLALEIPDPGLEQHGDDDEIGSDQSDEANSLIAVGDSDTDDDPDSSAQEDEGLTYTSGEEDESGPAMLDGDSWRARHCKAGICSRFRKAVRPYRAHYFHNQRDAGLYKDRAFKACVERPVDPSSELTCPRLRYADVSDGEGLQRFHNDFARGAERVVGASLDGSTEAEGGVTTE